MRLPVRLAMARCLHWCVITLFFTFTLFILWCSFGEQSHCVLLELSARARNDETSLRDALQKAIWVNMSLRWYTTVFN